MTQISYELAKSLKDAGFPQVIGEGDFVLHSFNEDETGITSANEAYAPTLSELIEACGERFKTLSWDKNAMARLTDLSWAAEAVSGLVDFGSNPEEAVARLWLALNKK